jgi:hypothetical protein
MNNAQDQLSYLERSTKTLDRLVSEIMEDYSEITPHPIIIQHILPVLDSHIDKLENIYVECCNLILKSTASYCYNVKRKTQKFKLKLLKKISQLNYFQLFEHHCLFTINHNSPLKYFLTSKIYAIPEFFSFHWIATLMTEIIKKEKLFDIQNPYIILCSSELEYIFKCSAFHIKKLNNFLIQHVHQITNLNQLKSSTIVKNNIFTVKNENEKLNPLSKHTFELFTLMPSFYQLLSTLPQFNSNQKIFTFQEIMNYFFQYITANKIKLFDPRNDQIAIIKNDPLGKLFKVSAFHRDQAEFFVNKYISVYKKTN